MLHFIVITSPLHLRSTYPVILLGISILVHQGFAHDPSELDEIRYVSSPSGFLYLKEFYLCCFYGFPEMNFLLFCCTYMYMYVYTYDHLSPRSFAAAHYSEKQIISP